MCEESKCADLTASRTVSPLLACWKRQAEGFNQGGNYLVSGRTNIVRASEARHSARHSFFL